MKLPTRCGCISTTLTTSPKALGPRVVLSQVLLMEGRDLDAAEQTLQDVLLLDPEHKETKHNLEVLRRNRRGLAAIGASA